MSGSAKVPGLARAAVMEWRARRIADPLDGVHYLSGAARRGAGGRNSRWTRGACGLALLLILALRDEAVLAPAAGSTDRTAAGLWPPRGGN